MRARTRVTFPVPGSAAPAGVGSGCAFQSQQGTSPTEQSVTLPDGTVIYNSGKYRMAGRGSLSGLLAYGNANQVVMEMAPEVLTAVQKTLQPFPCRREDKAYVRNRCGAIICRFAAACLRPVTRQEKSGARCGADEESGAARIGRAPFWQSAVRGGPPNRDRMIIPARRSSLRSPGSCHRRSATSSSYSWYSSPAPKASAA